jgi:hypothetical protein
LYEPFARAIMTSGGIASIRSLAALGQRCTV